MTTDADGGHDANRSRVCFVGTHRGDLTLTQQDIRRIRKFFLADYSPDDIHLPCGICSSCRSKLSAYERGDFSRSIHPSAEFFRPKLRPHRGNVKCECAICEVAEQPTHLERSPKKPRLDQLVLCKRCLTEIYPGKSVVLAPFPERAS